jgi:hypothetical protein
VAALGVPFRGVDVILDKLPFFKHRFHNFTLSESVENAYQALAIDDERKTFHPVFWDPEIKDYQNMKQVWFCGAHTDVGGGYKEHELSDIPLVWMIQRAVECGLKIYPKHHVEINQDINGMMHNPREGFPKNLFRKKVRSWNSDTHGKPLIHESVFERKLNRDNEKKPVYDPWILKLESDKETWDNKLPE